MSRNSTTYNRTFSGSVGAGIGSIIRPRGRKYYILEHKVSSNYHKSGENQEIIVDQIELGRAPGCQVRFDESFSTVSRRHAAIIREGDNWKLVPLSKTNSTYLNGYPVKNEWYLQNGDEIQLSTNGPKLGFIVPSGNKSTVGTIGLTRRLNLFRQQALRPYQNAIVAIASVLLIVLLAGGWLIYDLNKKNNALDEAMAMSLQTQENLRKENERVARGVVEKEKVISDMQGQISALKTTTGKLSSTPPSTRVRNVDNSALKVADKNVFFIISLGFEVTMPDGEKFEIECGEKMPYWSGTGFLLSDGRFVTARHVVEPWAYLNTAEEPDENMLLLNMVANNGGKVVTHLGAVSSSGDEFVFKSSDMRTNKRDDETYVNDEGQKIKVAQLNDKDWATFHLGKRGGLRYDAAASRNLERGTKLTILGFPLGLGASSEGVSPVYSSAVVAADGLQQGLILTTETAYERGNSGGPVFYTDSDGELVVVGITSAIAGRSTGFVAPISSIN